jgi:lipopolysaccharide transport system ATP-binding protein
VAQPFFTEGTRKKLRVLVAQTRFFAEGIRKNLSAPVAPIPTIMSNVVIKVENISKQYRLGNVGLGSLSHDINRWYHTTVRGREDPYLKIGETNDRSQKGLSEYVWALRDINFEVKQGEVLGIIGRNGAGKSTLLKILSRTTTPTTGEIKIKGRVASLLEVGTGFHPELTGRENIFLNGAILGMTKREIKSKFDEIVDFAGVERYIDTPVKRYSSGMYVRLAFGVAAHLEPEILIVDEVLAVGDAEFQKKALGKMKDISEGQGRTVLFVSHNMAAMQNLCKQGLLLENGRITFNGAMDEVIQKYLGTKSTIQQIAIAERTDRKGNGKIRVVDYKILDESNNLPVSILSTGKSLVLEIRFKIEKAFNINDFSIDIGITDEFDRRLIVMSNDILGKKIIPVGNDFWVQFHIKKLPLNSGIYNMVFFVKANKEISDWIDNVGEIIVEGGDFYKTGRVNQAHQGKFLVDYDTQIKNAINV